MSDDLVKNLVEAIKQEEALLKQFAELLEEQKRVLVRNDVEAFEDTVNRQEALIEEIKTLENQRIEQVKFLAKGLGEPVSDITMTRLVELSLGQVSDELAQAKESMNQLVNRIQRVSRVNQYLVKRSMNVAQRSIDWLIDGGEKEVTYLSNGQLNKKKIRPVLVNRTM